MIEDTTYKIRTKNKNLFLRISKGHFATSNSHINYYIDVTTQKTRLSEATAVAQELLTYYNTSTIIDTIMCLDGTEVIGTCLAKELTDEDFTNMNAHQTIYVVQPEYTSGNQLIFRDNTVPMINNKHVLILASSVTTGNTARSAIEAVKYYGGSVVGVSALFAACDECAGYPVKSVFHLDDLPDYASHSVYDCPLCKQGVKLDALVNGFGYSKL